MKKAYVRTPVSAKPKITFAGTDCKTFAHFSPHHRRPQRTFRFENNVRISAAISGSHQKISRGRGASRSRLGTTPSAWVVELLLFPLAYCLPISRSGSFSLFSVRFLVPGSGKAPTRLPKMFPTWEERPGSALLDLSATNSKHSSGSRSEPENRDRLEASPRR